MLTRERIVQELSLGIRLDTRLAEKLIKRLIGLENL